MNSPEQKSDAEEEEKEKDVRERVSPPGEVVYEAIYREGDHELKRTNRALAWSGLAAGLSMGFSFITEALLRSHLPDAKWTETVSKLGYSIGFLIVILGRQQLFTKNTLTVMLPLLNRRGRGQPKQVARLWCIVLAANLAGAFLFAWMLAKTQAFPTPVRDALAQIGAEHTGESFHLVALRAVLAGWLIALMIWLLPFAETARVWVITVLAYVVGLGHLPHIVAGSIPVFYEMLTGAVSITRGALDFLLPTFLGNAVGGVALVAALAHAELSTTAATDRVQ